LDSPAGKLRPVSVVRELPARSVDRRAALIAWAAMLLGSILPRVVWTVFAHEDAPPLVLVAQLVVLFGLSRLTAARSVHGYVVLLIGMVAGDDAYQLLRSTAAWQGWWAQLSEHERLFVDPFFELLPSAGVALTLVGSRLTRADLSLTVGDLSRRLRIGPLALTWWVATPIVALLLAGPLLAQLSFTVGPDPSAVPRVVPLVPAALLFSTLNAFLEEFRFRAAPLARLVPAVGASQALLVTSILFGIGHYYGHPSGLSGIVLASFGGWLLGLSMLGTRGIAAPWLIHGLQDLLIFAAVVKAET